MYLSSLHLQKFSYILWACNRIISFPCHADCNSLSSFAHISGQQCPHSGTNVWLFIFRCTHTCNKPQPPQLVLKNFCFLKTKIHKKKKKKWGTASMLQPNLFELYKSRRNRINSACLWPQFIFSASRMNTAFLFQCRCRATVGILYKSPPLGVIGLGWHLMWQALCEDEPAE